MMDVKTRKGILRKKICSGLNGTVESVRMLIANYDKDNRIYFNYFYDHTDHDIFNILEFVFLLYLCRPTQVNYDSIFITCYN